MEKFALLKIVNGAFAVYAEYTNIEKARVGYHQLCATLWNTADVERAVVELVDRDFNVFTGYKEFIGHEQSEA